MAVNIRANLFAKQCPWLELYLAFKTRRSCGSGILLQCMFSLIWFIIIINYYRRMDPRVIGGWSAQANSL